MWHWDQGRLAYFQFDNLRAIARYVLESDFKTASKDDLRQATGLPFSAPQTYSPWRNYSRTLKISLLVGEASGRAEPTLIAHMLARPGAVTCDDYIHFLACAFTEPSPALRGWRPNAGFRYPLLFALKYLLAKAQTEDEPTGVTLAEIVGAYGQSGFVGDEDEKQFADIVLSANDHASTVAGIDIRQARESLRVVAQLSYLHYARQALRVSLMPHDAAILFRELVSVNSERASTRDAEIHRLAGLFTSDAARPAADFVRRITPALAASGFREGNRLARTHVTIERNSGLRREFFKARDTAVCDMCAMDTVLSYPWTKRLLELHHLLPLSSGTRVTGMRTSLDDLVPVCPSCHRAVHHYYDCWLEDNGLLDFSTTDDARTAYDNAKAAFPGFVSHA